jgi:IclR family pca regulon transcriptional regulator
MNITVHAAETSVATLVDELLPRLIRAASEVSADWALWQSRPHTEVPADLTAPRAAGQIGGQVSV